MHVSGVSIVFVSVIDNVRSEKPSAVEVGTDHEGEDPRNRRQARTLDGVGRERRHLARTRLKVTRTDVWGCSFWSPFCSHRVVWRVVGVGVVVVMVHLHTEVAQVLCGLVGALLSDHLALKIESWEGGREEGRERETFHCGSLVTLAQNERDIHHLTIGA